MKVESRSAERRPRTRQGRQGPGSYIALTLYLAFGQGGLTPDPICKVGGGGRAGDPELGRTALFGLFVKQLLSKQRDYGVGDHFFTAAVEMHPIEKQIAGSMPLKYGGQIQKRNRLRLGD